MKLKFKFTIQTPYVHSEYKEIVELEFDEDATKNEIEEIVEEQYELWLQEHNHGGWSPIITGSF